MDISAAEFKAKCLKLLDEVAATGEPLVITKRGKPVARLLPVVGGRSESLFGYMKGSVAFHGDVVASTGETWSVEGAEEDALHAEPGLARR